MPIRLSPRPVRQFRRVMVRTWSTVTFYSILTVRFLLGVAIFLSLGLVGG